MIFFTHEKNRLNPGDSSCSPYAYLDFGKRTKICLSIHEIIKENISESDTVIIGGGGMLNNMYLPLIESILRENIKVIFWSIGTNRHFWPGFSRNIFLNTVCRSKFIFQQKVRYHLTRSIYTNIEMGILEMSQKAGLRDFQNNFEILPCCSCLHPVFDEYKSMKDENRFKVGIFGHKNFLDINEPPNSTKFDYIGKDIRYVVKSIAFCETVLTSSYHCAYWAMLLDKNVILKQSLRLSMSHL